MANKKLEKKKEREFKKKDLFKHREKVRLAKKAAEKIVESRVSILEHNIRLLKALEDEYIAEQKKRSDLNQELEAQGFKNIEEKMRFLHEQAIKVAEERGEVADFKIQESVEK